MEQVWLWTGKLATGVEEIDRQHRELIERANRLVNPPEQEKRGDTVGKTFRFLENYIVEHFEEEERLQRKYGYTGYQEHKRLHEEFMLQFEALRDRSMEEGITPDISLELSRTVYEWLVEHIGQADRVMAEYIRSKG